MTEPGEVETRDPAPVLVDTELGQVALTDEGRSDGWPVICVHGIPGSVRDFRYLAPHLGDGARVIRLDMPGFGASPSGGVETVQGWARVIGAAADALSLHQYVVLGHSFGGGAAILAGATDPDRVAGLVLIASMAHRRHRAFGSSSSFFRLFAWLLAAPPTRRLALAAATYQYRKRGLVAPALKEWPSLHRQLRVISSVSFSANAHAAENCLAPCLVCHAEDDHLVEIEITRELVEVIPHATPLIFPTGGHQLQKTRAREIGEAAARSFG